MFQLMVCSDLTRPNVSKSPYHPLTEIFQVNFIIHIHFTMIDVRKTRQRIHIFTNHMWAGGKYVTTAVLCTDD